MKREVFLILTRTVFPNRRRGHLQRQSHARQASPLALIETQRRAATAARQRSASFPEMVRTSSAPSTRHAATK